MKLWIIAAAFLCTNAAAAFAQDKPLACLPSSADAFATALSFTGNLFNAGDTAVALEIDDYLEVRNIKYAEYYPGEGKIRTACEIIGRDTTFIEHAWGIDIMRGEINLIDVALITCKMRPGINGPSVLYINGKSRRLDSELEVLEVRTDGNYLYLAGQKEVSPYTAEADTWVKISLADF